LHGYQVRLISRSEERLRAATASAAGLLRRRVEKGKLDAGACDAALARVTPGSDFSAVAGAATIIESVAEDRDIRGEVSARICEHADDAAIIGTNSSTLPSSLLMDAVTRPERFLNIHFFNPALLMALVEVVPGPHTAEDAIIRAMDFARAIGKTPVRLAREEYGFIANRIPLQRHPGGDAPRAGRLYLGGGVRSRRAQRTRLADGPLPSLRSRRARRGRGDPRRGLSADGRSALGPGRAAPRPGGARPARQQVRGRVLQRLVIATAAVTRPGSCGVRCIKA